MTVFQLPEGYRLLRHIDLLRDRSMVLKINLAAVVIMVGLVLVGVRFVPIVITLNGLSSLLSALLILLSIVVYIVLHEAVHGIFIKLFSGDNPTFGFNGFYAFAGNSRVFFGKWEYLVIAWSPVVLLGAFLFWLMAAVPENLFWPVYLIQILNLSGAVGDYYVSWLILRMPGDTLVKDVGVAMTFYSKK